MAEGLLDVVGIGNAIVDVLAHAEEAFLLRHGLNKGTMTLIDADQATALYDAMGPGIEVSGGSAANTIAGLASLGGAGGFIGKVGADTLGEIFRHDIRASGVAFATPPTRSGTPTARSLILVTPDAQRTMNTYLGACIELGPADVDPATIAAARVTYLEGYLWDPPAAKQAFLKAARIAHEAGRKVALSLSDPFCVGRHRSEFRDLLRDHVDILFANEAEVCSLYERNEFEAAVSHARQDVTLACLTRSEQGSLVVSGADIIEVPPVPTEVIDTTGAGDAYAAGFLTGLTAGRALAQCGQLGSIAAAEVISHYGARPQRDLRGETLALGS